ncbi:hypothetical protein, partial [Streptomyces ipomoeae]|uniref:hypothetical protein n=1 Tax=Streptomyces ipomoeae TaxID=103232 RepID=UPI00299F9226
MAAFAAAAGRPFRGAGNRATSHKQPAPAKPTELPEPVSAVNGLHVTSGRQRSAAPAPHTPAGLPQA